MARPKKRKGRAARFRAVTDAAGIGLAVYRVGYRSRPGARVADLGVFSAASGVDALRLAREANPSVGEADLSGEWLVRPHVVGTDWSGKGQGSLVPVTGDPNAASSYGRTILNAERVAPAEERRLPRCGTTHVPEGQKSMWTCTRGLGHEPPCAVVPTLRSPPTRAEGEVVRMREQLDRLRAMISSIERVLGDHTYLLAEADAIAQAGLRLATTAARHDAYAMAERDGEPRHG